MSYKILQSSTMGLLDKLKTGHFADLSFSTEQLSEIRYASLLHDFGKIGLWESVLVKAKKLYQEE